MMKEICQFCNEEREFMYLCTGKDGNCPYEICDVCVKIVTMGIEKAKQHWLCPKCVMQSSIVIEVE